MPTTRPPSRYGGRRLDGLYADGPQRSRPWWVRDIGVPLAATRQTTDAALHEQRQATVRRRARQEAPAPTLPHPRACRKTVRVVGIAKRGHRG